MTVKEQVKEPIKELTDLCFTMDRINKDPPYQWEVPEGLSCAHEKCEGYDTKCKSYTPLYIKART